VWLFGLAAAFAAFAGDGAVVALADSAPTLTTILPQVTVLNGQPLRVTVSGSNLSHVVSVTLVPAVSGLSFTVASDSTILLIVPASVPADTYGIFVTATNGTSDPANVPTFAVVPPVAADPATPSLPRYSFSPVPQPRYEPTTGVMLGPVRPTTVAPAPSRWLNPLLLLPVGMLLGGLGYLLWGRPGRLGAANRQGLAAHLVGRPAQALRIGRICLQCGRLHLVLATRRDLWQAGQFCSATCFVAAQEDDSAAG
jgi:IPT/TIG domain-containing protein